MSIDTVLTSYLSPAFIGADDEGQDNELREVEQELQHVKQSLDELQQIIQNQTKEISQ